MFPRKTLIPLLTLLFLSGALGVALADTPLPEGTVVAGGDDVVALSFDGIRTSYDPMDMVVAPNGDYYVAINTNSGHGTDIRVLRSPDGGDTWYQWGTKGLGMANHFSEVRLALVESPSPRLVIIYEYVKVDTNDYDVNISWSPLGDSANWTALALFTDANVQFSDPEIVSVAAPGGTILYAACKELVPGGGDRIRFSRSIDQGASWSTPYVIAQPTTTDLDYKEPRLAADEVGNVHVVWEVDPDQDNNYDRGVYYRHADNRAAAGLADWDAIKVVASALDGYDTRDPGIGAQPDGTGILVAANGSAQGSAVAVQWGASGTGTGWSASKQIESTAGYNYMEIVPHPDGGWVISGSQTWIPNQYMATWGFSRSQDLNPNDWDGPIFMADKRYQDGATVIHGNAIAVDPTRDNRVVMTWIDEYYQQADKVRFDAEGRDGPGFPNLDPAFPVAIDAPPVTDPLLANVNPFRAGDELVYGDADGLIHVIDTATGLDVPGWPQSVGSLVDGQTVAVGDLDGNGILDVVASSATGRIFAWRGDGALLPGWPVQMGWHPHIVSLGAVSKKANLDVVVATDNQVHLLRPDGQPSGHGQWPIQLPSEPVAPASLGDVDMDGRLEVVVTMGNRVSVYQDNGSAGWSGLFVAGMIAPTALGDLNGDGDLELVIPGGDGNVMAFHHDGAAVGGFWPQMTTPNEPVAGLALAMVDFVDGLEVAALGSDGDAYLFRSTGFPYTGFPKTTGFDFYAAPILDDVDGDRADLIAGDIAGVARAYKENDVDLGGWPKDMGMAFSWTPVAGDMDADGQTKIIFLTHTQIVKLDVNDAADLPEERRWPMFAHDAQRTSCAEHSFDAVTAVGDPLQATLVSFAPPSPNPVVGSTHLSYRLPGSADVRLEIFDVRGRRVRTLVAGRQPAGAHTIQWDTRDSGGQRVAQGQYFGRLVVRGDEVNGDQTRKITVVH